MKCEKKLDYSVGLDGDFAGYTQANRIRLLIIEAQCKKRHLGTNYKVLQEGGHYLFSNR